ncbi:gliding motility-associated C-terminal domain-containing protein [Maribacter polysaccharolyticus]|uniref:T9SS type B sorting domain-containing protein n=1 Tax=Maribacter polysaccharolyticus TaxID=3020831 RepID=UPI00237FBB38|nr:gliding motility-associated C-terminal domain-containing protein [Maribacter polysaccharolyticus]MDE3742204.1 gliding motility-associated C-terminal domain-containing protein [Maribacter polysaccharolyticus]
MKRTTCDSFTIFCFFFLLTLSQSLTAQSGVGANFGIEADIHSGNPNPENDDWFQGTTGAGVIDESNLDTFKGYIDSGQNIAFKAAMDHPNYTAMNGRLWYGAIFGHDLIADKKDNTAFQNGKNGDNPNNWGVNPSAIAKKADIVDAYVHVRREGPSKEDNLWVTAAVSTLDNGGAHYTDVEFYIEELTLADHTFSTIGAENGHTAWQFDGDGKVTKIGDLDVGFDYSGSSVMSLDIRIWISREDYLSKNGFDYKDFDSENSTSPYGYAHVDCEGSTFSVINSAPVEAPPWGTYSTGLTASSSYSTEALAEVGIDFTALGFDPVLYGLENSCYFPYSTVLVKTRGSASFDSGLVDFAGPYPFLGKAEEGTMYTSLLEPVNFDSCEEDQSISLEADFTSSSALYFWESLTPGVTFPNGETTMEGLGLTTVDIDNPGTYTLNIAPCQGCDPDPDNASSVTVYAQPCAVDDMVQVTKNSSVVIQVLDNDIDLDSNIDVSSIDNSGLLQPSNGTVSLSKQTGEIVYTPDDGYLGADLFEYQICDTDGLCDIGQVTVETLEDIPPPFIDSDNDGILDRSDLDDDNDGIPDIQELNTIIANSQPECGGETTLDFSDNAVLVSGTALQQGAVYRIPNVATEIDALITIVRIYNATVAEIDNNSMAKEAFRPYTAFNFANKGDQGLIEYKIRFVGSGGSSPVVLDKIIMNFNDIDGTDQYGEQTWSYNPTSYVVSNPTELTMSTDGKWVIGTAGTTTYPTGSNIVPQVNYGVNYNSRSEISIRVGAVARVAGASSTQRQHNIEFGCVTNYIDPQVYGLDNDWDGVTNQLDLDVDNDGIYDAVEAGHNQTHTNGVVDGPYGSNGLADNVETEPESGTINYEIINTDGTPGPDYMDTDSDDDGCSDANEAYNDPNADEGDNAFYGNGSPSIINDHGAVVGAAYTLPVDINANGEFEFRENTAPYFLIQPNDESVCPGGDTSFSVSAANTGSYQWQLLDGSDWIDLNDSGIHGGTQTDVLTISNASIADNGNSYRVLINNDSHICPVEPSIPVTLHVNTPTVTANASATRINAGEYVTLSGEGAENYVWDNEAADGIPIQLFHTTVFTVIGEDAMGCTGTDTITIEVTGGSDLSLDKTVDHPEPNSGDIINFSLTLTNLGPEEATNVTIEDRLPTGYTLQSNENGASIQGNVLSWTLPTVPVGEQILTYGVMVNLPTGGNDEYRNIAQITEVDQLDPDSSPNNDDDDQSEDDEDSHIIPTPVVDLGIKKSVKPDFGAVGDEVVFSISVNNLGPYEATNLGIIDELPIGYSYVSYSDERGSYDPVTGVWEMDALGIGETAELAITAIITEMDDYINMAYLAYVDQLDFTPKNDTSMAEITLTEEEKESDSDCLVVFNEFSPNSDGSNDVFYIECIEDYPNNHLQIFNRWGKKVFETKGYKNDWNGTVSTGILNGMGTDLPVGTYFYLLDFGDGGTPVKSGWLYISR